MRSSRLRATLTGLSAILMWSLLGVFTGGTGKVPPFLLTGLCFGLSGLVATLGLAVTGRLGALRQPWRVYAVGTAGLFGYHALYFAALQLAPPAEANLVNYLWPLLIVLFSGLLPGERLRPLHVLGALIAFAGAALVVAGPGAGFSAAALPGYAAAAACALIWSGYSILSRRLGQAPTETVTVFCLATAALSALAHLALETTVWPGSALAWASLVALGLGPVGLAFYLWDIGVKRGDIQLLGTASYAAPLLSTLILVLAGFATPSLGLGLSALLIAGGALLAARAG